MTFNGQPLKMMTYPALLREIYLPPAVLYSQGLLAELSSGARPELVEGCPRARKYLAIVGARKADEYGQRAVQALVPDLVAAAVYYCQRWCTWY